MGKWRVITKLSHPPGFSVDDAIYVDLELCSMVKQVVIRVMQWSIGALTEKVEIKSAYSLVLIQA